LEHLICALDEKYIDEATFQNYRKLIEHCWKVLNGYILEFSKNKTGHY
ncbi:MAG: four helix bundle protein, partial [Bacteroidetes bacterium]